MFGRVPALNTPTFAVTSGQRPFRAWISRTSSRAGDDRAAALLGLDAGVRRAARRCAGGCPPCPCAPTRTSPLARAHSSTNAASRLARDLDDVRRRGRRADLLVGVGDERDPLERQVGRSSRRRAPAAPRGRASRRAARPSCRSRRGPSRSPCPSIVNGRFATVPSSKTVSMWPIRRMRGPAPGRPSNVPTTVSPKRPLGIRPPLDRRAERARARPRPSPDLVDARRRVAPAVDRAEPLEVGEEGRQAGLDGRLGWRSSSSARDERARRGGEVTAAVYGRWPASGRARCYPRGPCA